MAAVGQQARELVPEASGRRRLGSGLPAGLHDDREVLLLVKTRTDRFADVARVVDELHSYELPAVTMVAITGTRRYLEWIDRQVGGGPNQS